MKKNHIIPLLILALCLSGCAAKQNAADLAVNTPVVQDLNVPEDAIEIRETYTSEQSDTHAIEVSGTEETYDNVLVRKSGDSEGDEADFYGTNAAVFASDGASLTVTGSTITTDGKHANAVFSYGEGTTVNISDCEIRTEQDTSGGIMVTGGGKLNASNLTVTTKARSSAPIRSDRGGGELNVKGGTYESYGSGSPAIYSTADICVENASLYSDVSEAVVIEGKNSVTITDSDVTGKHTTQNSGNADVYRNVMIYQSMSGDASEGKGTFSMTGGSLTSKNGGMFFVTNTVAEIDLNAVAMQYASDDLLRIEKAGWGREGLNGGQVTLHAAKQTLDGVITVDEISTLNMYLAEGSSFAGSIASEGKVYVELDEGSTWTLTGNTAIDALTCDEDAIRLNGYTLTVGGTEYEEGTAAKGEAFEVVLPAAPEQDQMPPEKPDGADPPPTMPDGSGTPPEMPDENGMPPEKPDGNGMPPEKPDGNGMPPEKPDGNGMPPEKPDGNGQPPAMP